MASVFLTHFSYKLNYMKLMISSLKPMLEEQCWMKIKPDNGSRVCKLFSSTSLKENYSFFLVIFQVELFSCRCWEPKDVEKFNFNIHDAVLPATLHDFYHFNFSAAQKVCCVGGDRTAIGWNGNLSTNERAAGKLLKEEFSWDLCKIFLWLCVIFRSSIFLFGAANKLKITFATISRKPRNER